MKNLICRTLIIAVLSCSTFSAKSQETSDTINRIDYLNLNGTFVKYNFYYIDTSGASYGLFNIEHCEVFTTHVVGKKAIVRNSVVAAYRQDRNYIELHYPDNVVYCKFKDKDFTKFLRENTNNGKLVNRDKILIDGKKPKMYCNIKMRTYKLIDRCE
ncbi:MAG: hypothetical protein MK105_18690 [Crocinitomicaceae bacterium]|nr:hypothetical protein [Crocinitomicaceae bacterium]